MSLNLLRQKPRHSFIEPQNEGRLSLGKHVITNHYE